MDEDNPFSFAGDSSCDSLVTCITANMHRLTKVEILIIVGTVHEDCVFGHLILHTTSNSLAGIVLARKVQHAVALTDRLDSAWTERIVGERPEAWQAR